MDDIISNYKKQRKIKNISIVITSLVLALGLNLFLGNTDSWKYIKTSVMNSMTNTQQISDLFFENNKTQSNLISLKSSKQMIWIKTLSFSIAYNKDNVSLKNKLLKIDNVELIELGNNEWFNTIVLNFKNPTNLKINDNILDIIFEKKSIQKENINLVWANFIDTDNSSFTLSTSSIEF